MNSCPSCLWHQQTQLAARCGRIRSGEIELARRICRWAVARADLEPDGRACEAEGFADLIFEEALEGEVQLHLAVGEEDEGGRRDGGLGHVVDADLLRQRARVARWKSTRSRKRFIWPVETRLRRSVATSVMAS